jgi:hypothetical protein
MNYIQRASKILDEELPDLNPELRQLYLLLLLTVGVDTTLEQVHDAWAIWCADWDRQHPSIVPFDQLAPGVRELDRPYAEGIQRAARRIYSQEWSA